MKLKELREKRARIVAEMRAIADKPEGDAGAPSENQEKRFEVLKGELTLVEKSIDKQELVDEADKRAAGHPIGETRDADFDRECRAFSLTRAIAASAGVAVDAGREREVSALRRIGLQGTEMARAQATTIRLRRRGYTM